MTKGGVLQQAGKAGNGIGLRRENVPPAAHFYWTVFVLDHTSNHLVPCGPNLS